MSHENQEKGQACYEEERRHGENDSPCLIFIQSLQVGVLRKDQARGES